MICMFVYRWKAIKNGNLIASNPQEIVRRKVDIDEAHSEKFQKELKNKIVDYIYESVLSRKAGAEGSRIEIELNSIVPYY